MTKEIQLTRGQVVKVDDSDYEWLSQWKWYAWWSPRSKAYYAVRSLPGKRVYMARLIMGARRGEMVDHENHDTLDNRRENLRVCTQSQNMANSRKHADNTSGFKGVSWYKRNEKWQVHICLRYKKVFLGYFTDVLAAADAYDKAAHRLHGEFSLTNGRV